MTHPGPCLDSEPRGIDTPTRCSGEVAERRSVTGATTAVRCQRHDDDYRDRVQPAIDRINERYPDSEFAPSWFDPTYAGESWNGD